MNFEFSEEQRQIGMQARTVLSERCTSKTVRDVLEGEHHYSKPLWNTIVELGWTATCIPEEYGGLGLSYLELVVIAEELGRALAPIPFSSSVYVATEALLIAGSAEQKQEWLPALASGQAIGTFSISTNLKTQRGLVVASSSGELTGKLADVPEAQIADFCIAECEDEATGNRSLYLVDLKQSQIEACDVNSIDPTRNYGELYFNHAQGELLGSEGYGPILSEKISRRAAVLFAWEQLGGAEATLEQAIEYSKQRHAFGRPIGSFQAVKHKLAQSFIKNTIARSNCYFGAWSLRADRDELTEASMVSRVSATQAYQYIAKENIQTHGGVGITWEYDCHLHYRRAKSLSVILGSESAWKQRLGKRLLSSDHFTIGA